MWSYQLNMFVSIAPSPHPQEGIKIASSIECIVCVFQWQRGSERLYIGEWKISYLINVTECRIWFRMSIIYKEVEYTERPTSLASQILTI